MIRFLILASPKPKLNLKAKLTIRLYWLVIALLINHSIYSTNVNEDTNLIKNLDSLINIVQTSDDKHTLVDLGIQLGKKNYKKGNLDEAITYFEVAKDAAVQLGDSEKEITCLKFLNFRDIVSAWFWNPAWHRTRYRPLVTSVKCV